MNILDRLMYLCNKKRAKQGVGSTCLALTTNDRISINMAEKPNITPELLRQLLRYEPETGKLFWKERPRDLFVSKRGHSIWTAKYADKEITTQDGKGYIRFSIFGRFIRAHRAAWLISNGRIPLNLQIDHINHNKNDNRLANLRVVTNQENSKNKAPRKNTGVYGMGVTYVPKLNKWVARITNNMKTFYLGIFETPEQAIAARKNANNNFNFHNNHMIEKCNNLYDRLRAKLEGK